MADTTGRHEVDGTETAENPEPFSSYGLRVVVLSGPGKGKSVSIKGGGVCIGSESDNDLAIDDRRLSRHHLELVPHPGGLLIRDLASTNGTFFGGVRIGEAVVPPGAVIRAGDTEVLIESDRESTEIPPSSQTRMGLLVGRSIGMRRLFTVLERVAPTDYTVLIEGETGTGKELVARTLHELSGRRNGPLVVFDCAATTESLLESELFGHVRGAFTGAVKSREGAFRRAHGGTLFIDELSSLPISLQGKLLRALEQRTILPVGADAEIAADVRIVAASNRSLLEEVRAKRMREDLYFRLSVVRVVLPPLRERREDIPMLIEQFLRAAGIRDLTPAGRNLDQLMGYAFPGNIRELRNVLERALAMGGRSAKRFDELSIVLDDNAPTLSSPVPLDLQFKDAKDQMIDAFERLYVSRLLEQVGNNVSEAARRAGLSRRHFHELLRKHGLRGDDTDSEEN